MSQITKELLNAPFPEMVKNLGKSIAEAQYALDRVSMKLAQEMVATKVDLGGKEYSLLALGFTPTFYQYVDTLIEIKMVFSMTQSKEVGIEATVGASYLGIVSASVTGSYSQKYQYSAEGSSLMRTKLVTIPSPPILEQRLRELQDAENKEEN